MSIKSVTKHLASRAIQNDFIWKLFDRSINRAAIFARLVRDFKGEDNLIPQAIQTIVPDLVVKHGPFQGMKYISTRWIGGAVFPKLLGCYERELHKVVEDCCQSAYTEVVDIGCAEGYYAVGFALRLPAAKVYAFDIQADGIELCRKMAEANEVAERIITGAFCDEKTLCGIPFRGRALIISDCEGYEKTLFSSDVAQALAAHDLLIEAHDFLDITISSTLRQRFENTHTIAEIESIDDIVKAYTYDYSELTPYGLQQRKLLLSEGRPSIMRWLFLQSRSKSGTGNAN